MNTATGPDVTLIGAAVVDVLARPVTPEVFLEGSAAVRETQEDRTLAHAEEP